MGKRRLLLVGGSAQIAEQVEKELDEMELILINSYDQKIENLIPILKNTKIHGVIFHRKPCPKIKKLVVELQPSALIFQTKFLLN